MNKEKKELWHQGEIGPDVVLRDVCKDTVNNVLVAVGDDGRIFRRYGAGVGWMTCVSGFGKEDHVFGVATDNNGNFWACGRGGFILKSDNQGVTWSTKRKQIGDGNVMKLAAGNGMLLAILDRSNLKKNNVFLKSTDAGETWFEFICGIPNACSIEFLASRFYVGTKSKNIFCGNGTDKFLPVRWDSLSFNFEGARCLGYNEVTKTFFAGGHQLATSLDGVEWWAKLDLTKHEQFGKRNIQAVVPVNEDTFLIGEDMLMFNYRDALFVQVGSIGKGSVLGAVLHDDRIITVGSAGERYILLDDLGVPGETIPTIPPLPVPPPPVPPTPTPPVPPTPESLEKRVENVLVDIERDIALIREMVKGK